VELNALLGVGEFMGMDDVDADDFRDEDDADDNSFETDSDEELDVPGVRASVVITAPTRKANVLDDDDSDFQSDEEGS
jgi:hypothetical protein